MKKILVRAPNWIGDQILAFPFFHFLRKAYPRARITVACVPWVEDLQFRDLINDVIVLNKPAQNTFKERFTVLEEGAKKAREQGPWDLAIALPNSFGAGYFLFRSGARKRRGYATDGRGVLLNDRVQWNATSSIHRAQSYVDLLPDEARPKKDVLNFWGIPPENELDEEIPGEMKQFAFDRSWKEIDFLKPPETPYWILAPGATAESRRWPLQNYVRLARVIYEKTGMKGIIVGGKAESLDAEGICGDPSLQLEDWTAQCPVPGLARLFRGAKFTVCNESGLAHVAALCGSFVQIVCGAADPKRTRPVGPGKVQIAVNPVECWPCERNHCFQENEKKLQCLRGITPELVWEEIERGIKPRRTS